MKILLFLFSLATVFASEKVDIIANFNLDELAPHAQMAKQTGLEIRSVFMGFSTYLDSLYTPDVKKIIIMNDIAPQNELAKLPKEKLIYFSWEPGGASAEYCRQFSRVYTFNDLLVDRIRYFKFYYPVLLPMPPYLPPFALKKLCVLMTQTRTPEREKMIRFFETKREGDFDYFGFNPIVQTPLYRGRIPGHPLSPEKLSILEEYRFAICFENSFIPGYITEKIFTCFAAGCVPIYLGAPNVETYIPKECFIDYRDFQNDEELYQYITTMSSETYETYIDNIRLFLDSEQAELFSTRHFNQIIRDATYN